jgi:hypothetical protein
LSGRRIWFSHIDGDGWNNISYLEDYRDKSTIAATVVLRELIAPYPTRSYGLSLISRGSTFCSWNAQLRTSLSGAATRAGVCEKMSVAMTATKAKPLQRRRADMIRC